jgi:predicted DNA-binding transcriptional regulator YafY
MTIRDRHDAIIRSLRRKGVSTVDELAKEVGISRRTILRDICALRDQGFTIYSEPGRGGGLQLDPQSVQTTTRLSVTEVFALLISVETMRIAGQLPFSNLADAGFSKIEKTLPADKVRELRQFLRCLHIGKLSPKQDASNLGPIDPALLPAFEAAFLQKQMLGFQYCDANGHHTNREVEPQAMLVLPPLWYLVAWDPARDNFRHFRMDRISAPAPNRNTSFRQRYVPFEDHICPFKDVHGN